MLIKDRRSATLPKYLVADSASFSSALSEELFYIRTPSPVRRPLSQQHSLSSSVSKVLGVVSPSSRLIDDNHFVRLSDSLYGIEIAISI